VVGLIDQGGRNVTATTSPMSGGEKRPCGRSDTAPTSSACDAQGLDVAEGCAARRLLLRIAVAPLADTRKAFKHRRVEFGEPWPHIRHRMPFPARRTTSAA
jgi:hypothetical protein